MQIGIHKVPESYQGQILKAGYKKCGDTLCSLDDVVKAFTILHREVKNWADTELYFHVIEGSVDGVAESLKRISQTKTEDLKLDEYIMGLASIFNAPAKVNLYYREKK